MSLIFDRISNKPQTHALVIGVGGYRYLTGGAEPRDQVFEAVGLLGQLTSPPRSALGFAQWLESTQDQWRAPLGSIELFVSPAPGDPLPAGINVDPATIRKIQDGYNHWKQRCKANEDNIAVFFYSGHGVEKQEHYLLAEDFGENPNNPWLGSFAFDSTRRAFHACKAKTQCFFVDACRKVTSGMLQHDLPKIPLDVENMQESADCDFNLTLKAAAHNETAHGPKNKPSYFTQAILNAFKGAAASRRGSKWAIKTGEISANINDILRMVKISEGYRQRCISTTSGSGEIFRLTNVPHVPVSIACQPDQANALAALSCKNLESGACRRRGPKKGPWRLTVDAGIYRIMAKFADGEGFHDCNRLIPFDPPLIEEILECQ